MSVYTEAGLAKLATLIQENRVRRGLGLRAYADLVGVHHATIDRLETKRFKEPTNDTLSKLAPYVGLSLFELIAIASEQPREAETPYRKAEEMMLLLADLPMAELQVLHQWIHARLNSASMVIQNFDFSNKAGILDRNGDHMLPPHLKAPGCVPHYA